MRRTGIQAHACTQHALAACARSIRSQVRAQARTHAPHEHERTCKPINALARTQARTQAGSHAGGQAGTHARTPARKHARTHKWPPSLPTPVPPLSGGAGLREVYAGCACACAGRARGVRVRRACVHRGVRARSGRGGAPGRAAGFARARSRAPRAAVSGRRTPALHGCSGFSLPVVRRATCQASVERGRGVRGACGTVFSRGFDGARTGVEGPIQLAGRATLWSRRRWSTTPPLRPPPPRIFEPVLIGTVGSAVCC